MNTIQLLHRQTEDAYHWANSLIQKVADTKWSISPPTLETNMNWQVGHLLLSNYYHSIMCIRGHQMGLLKQMPMKDYSEYFDTSSPSKLPTDIHSKELFDHLVLVQGASLKMINTLTEAELTHPLVPTQTPHPIAKTKYEAIDWNIKHSMWHVGQIAILLRVLEERYDFGRIEENT